MFIKVVVMSRYYWCSYGLYLVKAELEVRVLEQGEVVAMETSFANAGQAFLWFYCSLGCAEHAG